MKIESGNSESFRSRKFVNKFYSLYELLWVNRPLNRVYFMVFFLVPISALVLSVTFFYRQPLINEAAEKMKPSMLLIDEMETAEAIGYEKKMEIAAANLEAVRKRVPGSYEDVSDWILNLSRFVSLKGFKMSYNLGELKPAYKGVVGLSLLPVNLKLTVEEIAADQTKSVSTGTIQVVELLHEMVKSYYGVDLAGVVATGNGDGMKTIAVSINLWVGFGSKP